MAVEPNTTIKLYRNVPLDSDYRHTLYFTSKAEQTNYFNSVSILWKNYPANSYQRVNKGTIRVEEKADFLYDCNYLAFQNTNHGNKWFYAFVTKVEYINENVTEITYDIDVMQTYFFDYDTSGVKKVRIEDSFIEREHSETDNVGDNLLDESIELGEYVTTDLGKTDLLSDLSLVVALPYKTLEYEGEINVMYETDEEENLIPQRASFTKRGGLMTGLNYVKFSLTESTTYNKLNNFIDYLNKKGLAKDIVAVYYQPTLFTQSSILSQDIVSYNITKPKYNTSTFVNFDGYTPKNKKLYTAPYNFLCVSNLQGTTSVYPYEYFSSTDGNVHFKIYATDSPGAEIMLYPYNYKGVLENYDEKMTLSGYSSVGYAIDEYRDYLANHKASLSYNMVSNSINTLTGVGVMAGSIAMGNPMGIMFGASRASSGLNAVMNQLADLKDRRVSPAQAQGSSANSVLLGANQFDFRFYNKRIRGEYAKIIDEYFSMYGYKCHRVKTPNLRSRKKWNYIKTIGANIYGLAPAPVIEKIQNIFNDGITFWHSPEYMGDYTGDNTPR